MGGSFLQLILDNLYRLWPIRVVDVDEQGVRHDRGREARLLLPGTHFFLPGLQRIEKYNVKYQENDCGLQSMETKDGQAVVFSLNIGYTISDAALMATSFYAFDSTLKNLARGRMAHIVHETAFADLQQLLPDIMLSLRRDLRRIVGRKGVRVKRVQLDEFVRSRQYRVLSASPFPL